MKCTAVLAVLAVLAHTQNAPKFERGTVDTLNKRRVDDLGDAASQTCQLSNGGRG